MTDGPQYGRLISPLLPTLENPDYWRKLGAMLEAQFENVDHLGETERHLVLVKMVFEDEVVWRAVAQNLNVGGDSEERKRFHEEKSSFREKLQEVVTEKSRRQVNRSCLNMPQNDTTEGVD